MVHFVAASDAAGKSFTVNLTSGSTTWVQALTVNSGDVTVQNNGGSNMPLGVSSTWTVSPGASLKLLAGTASWGALNMNAFSLTAAVSGTMEIAGLGNSAGSLTKTGTGTLTISKAGKYTGDTIVSSGTLVCATPSLADGAAVYLNTGATIVLPHGYADRVRRLYIDGLEQSPGKWGAPGSVAGGTADFESPLISGSGVLWAVNGAEVTPVTVDPAGAAFTGTLSAEFNTDGSFGGWTTSQVSGATVAGGVLSGTSSRSAPWVLLTGTVGLADLDLGFNDYLEVRMQVPANYAGDIQFSYGTIAKPGFGADRMFAIPATNVAKDGAFHTYRIDLGLERLWGSTLTDLRIQPVNAAGLAFAIDYIRVGDLPGDTYVTYYGDWPSAGDHELISKHFRFRWLDNLSNDGTPTGMNTTWAHENLRNIEQCWQVFVKHLGYKEPNVRSGVKYKTDFICEYGGNWATGSGSGHSYLNIGPGGLGYNATDNGSTVISHEFTHVMQFEQGGSMPGDWYENHANYGRERRYEYYEPARSELTTTAVRDGHFALHPGRTYYESWPFYLYLDENPDNLPGLGEGTVAKVWQQCAANEYPYATLARIASLASLKDAIGGFARRMATADFKYQTSLQTSCGGIPGDVFASELVQTAEDPAWWRVPHEKAPMQGGYAMHPLVVTGSGAGRTVTVDLRPLVDPTRGSEFRAALVVMSDEGSTRYSTLWSSGTNSVTLAANENKLWLTVAATPTNMPYVAIDESPGQYPFRSAVGKQRHHYEVQITGATPRETAASSTSGLVQHANGGGWKASSATVASTAFVGPNARVLGSAQVLNSARVEDYAVVSGNAVVSGSAVVSGHATVTGSVGGNARVRDFASVSATVNGNARVLQHAEVTGGTVGGNAIVRGFAGDGGGTVNGWTILDGAYFYWGDANNTFAAAHEPWVGLSDSWKFLLPAWTVASFPFDANHGDLALDYLSGMAAFARGATWTASDTGRTGVLTFSGSNQWLTFDRSVVDSGAFTLDFWVKPQGGAANQALFWIGSSTTKRLVFTPDDGTGHAKVMISNGGADISLTGTAAIPVGTWSNVVLALDGTTGRLIVNGTQSGSASISYLPENLASGNANSTPLRVFIGRGEGSVHPMFQGAVDDVKFYSRALGVASVVSNLTNQFTWDGSTDDWNNGHWSPDGISFVSGGVATINSGIVTMTAAATAASVTLNGGTLVTGAGRVLDGFQALTLNAGATLRANANYSVFNGPVTLNGGTISTSLAGDSSYGNFVLKNTLTVGGTQTSTISADLRIGDNADRVFNIAPTGDPSGIDLLFSGVLGHQNNVSWGYMTKTGSGTMALSSTANMIGRFTVSAGRLLFLEAMSGGINGGIVNNATVETRVSGSSNISYSQAISGTGQFIKSGAGQLTLLGANSFSGVTQINGGSLRLGNGATSSFLAGTVVNNASLVIATDSSLGLPALISGSGTLTKTGTGELILAGANTYTGSTVIEHGSVRVSPLRHRWSFNGNLANSTGGPSATAVGGVTLSSTQATLTGGASGSSYISLGQNILPNGSASPLTMEVWATEKSIKSWSRIFDFGSGTSNYFMMSWTQGTTSTLDRVEVSPGGTVNNSMQPYSLNTQYHISMVINPGAGSGGTNLLQWARRDAAGTVLKSGSMSVSWNLSQLGQTNLWLGHSQFSGDNDGNASYNEVRIWDTALTQSQLSASAALGPDALPPAGASLPSASDVRLLASDSVLDLAGNAQTIGSLDGVAGSKVLIGSGALTAGGNGFSTTFAGVLSGSGTFTKTGAGTMTLTASNTFTGSTIVAGGKLAASGSLASGVTASAGTFAPRGVLVSTGTVSVGAGGRFEVRINGGTVGTQYDQLSTSGGVTLAGALDIVAAPGLATGSTFTILNKTSAGVIGGTFAGKPEGSVFAASGYNWLISYAGGDGNDVVLTIATEQQAWRYANFGTATDAGTAADSADPNNDGETNFLEFATGQNANAATRKPGELVRIGEELEFTYTRSIAAMNDGVTFSVEWSDTLIAGSWTSVGAGTVFSDNGTVQTVKATIPAGSGPKRFVRLKVTK